MRDGKEYAENVSVDANNLIFLILPDVLFPVYGRVLKLSWGREGEVAFYLFYNYTVPHTGLACVQTLLPLTKKKSFFTKGASVHRLTRDQYSPNKVNKD